MAHVNPHNLEVFRIVARLGSVTRAAVELGVSQPAVSAHVRELERACAMPLLERRPRGVCLTAAGETVYGYARQVAATLASLDQALADLRGLDRGRLVIGACTTVGEFLLPEIMGAFHARHPGIELQLAVANSSEIVARVLANESELGFVGEWVAHPELVAVAWREDRIVPVVSPSHELTRLATVSLAELVRHPWIAREPGSSTRKSAEAWTAAHGVRLQPAMALGSNEAIKRAVAAGLGFGLISQAAVSSEVMAHQLVALNVAGWVCCRHLTLCYRRERDLGQVHRAFLAVAGIELPSQPVSCPIDGGAPLV